MFRLSSIFIVLIIMTSTLTRAVSQSADNYIIFAWNGTIYTQDISSGDVVPIGATFADFDAVLPGFDVYSLAASPLTETPGDGYGFHHGVWSPDRSRFAYLEINPPRYRVRIQTSSGDNQILLEDQLNTIHGYLDPIGWSADGRVMLLDRILLNHLDTVNIWWIDPTTLALNHDTFIPIERLSGRSALLPDGSTVFLGFSLMQNFGFLLDFSTGQARIFTTQLAQTILPPSKGFEYYPLQVFGGLSDNEVAEFTAQIQSSTNEVDVLSQPMPFLHWPLPDDKRHVTCYTDSLWTNTNFEVTCPGISAQRIYEGHQGTDIGGKPSGLPRGTSVYPAVPGVVVATYQDCMEDNPSCNAAYGNTVTLEHILIDNGETQVWYTGYGHLQTVLVENYTYLANMTEPLGLSGATGIGGAHLHFEVRSTDNWVDPWDDRAGQSLWLGSNARPLAGGSEITTGEASEVSAMCTSTADNNIRSGPGTTFESVDKTEAGITYKVLEVAFVDSGDVLGDWYRVQYEGGEGWLWFRLLHCS